ncbi:DEAD/DEAH box helicase [Collimonas sp. OK412]|jgi:superfamily II DNA/RNA helicase|uniref:DEAD/DEAH box helicase n=1 Tax=Collimonas sp. (strain OK412) TaxID=1801619 RepID=UPI0008E804BD|nr:DEAD/DEAH box helicase [Collimonas sp. OK412]SFC69060.1 Superfamily II DNA and RNA helicase [Collimonas sp. OK412]
MSDIQSEIQADPAVPTTPTVRFADFGLSPDILRALSDQGYVHPTPIQAEAIPVVLQGRDVMGAAQTGTGKTAGFSLPIIQLLLAHANTSASPARHPVRALILTPTRELADQVAENVKAYCRHTPLRSTVVFGGVDIAPQTAALRSGIEIVIATPGRLLDHVQQKTLNLSQTQILVMDEADRMLDMGFLPDLQRIINLLPKERQNLMFSATFSGEIKKLAATFLKNPVTIEVARSNATADNVTQTMYHVNEQTKAEAVSHIIRERKLKQVIVFSNTKIGASKLARHLENEGVNASAIHGDKTQNERMAALEAFKRGEIEVLVATDVAARGLDIAELPCVINFDLPYNAEDYVHRIGRTGRAGASGDAISLYADKDERLLVDIEKMIKYKFVRAELTGFVAKPASAERERSSGRGADARNGRGDSRGVPSSDRSTQHTRSAYTSTPTSRKEKIDPWFLKPYEPTLAAEVDSASVAPAGGSIKPSKVKLAALLGGLPKN